MSLRHEQLLGEIDSFPRARATQLRRLGIEAVGDLVTHYPRRHEDRRQFDRFPHDEGEQPVCLCGDITKTRLLRFGGRKIFEATLEETEAHALSQPVVLRWFNLHYVQKMVLTGQRLVVFGKPRRRGSRLCMEHPEFEVIENDEEISIHFRRITPIYPATEGLSQRILRGLIYHLLQEYEGDDPATIREMHFPESWQSLAEARQELVYQEFFGMQMLIAARRARARLRPGQAHCGSAELLKKFLRALPFRLTSAQMRTIEEIQHDLGADFPMNRLLQGDVGSGKTVVAIAAMLLAVESGTQAALMAPTQILAEQHFSVLQRWLDPLHIRIALRTAARQQDTGPLPLWANFDGEFSSSPAKRGEGKTGAAYSTGGTASIIIGTHALLYEPEGLDNPGLVVIDEQHKFGVSQRARLTNCDPAPDVLVMTATPIPRTLTMSLYGDLDVSIIDEMPSARGRIVTVAREPSKLPEILDFLRIHLGAGRQAYIVYPLIDESEKLEAKAASAEFRKWQTSLEPFTCALLHGRLPGPEKQEAMEQFRRGETSVLVSTTVIEVGVDVPNASVMLIENAERFGLAQLHQLRGRIGRGPHKSFCILLRSDSSPETTEKLAVLERTSNGFEIAEADWELRGPGDVLGTAQSGLPALKLGDLRRDVKLMQEARVRALQIMEDDPALSKVENQRFRPLVVEQEGKTFSHVS